MIKQNNFNIIIAFKNKLYFNKIVENISSLSNVSILASSENTLSILLLCKKLLPDLLIYELSPTGITQEEQSLINKIHTVYNGKIAILATSSEKNADKHISDALLNGADLYMSNLDKIDILESAFQIISSDRSSEQIYTLTYSELSRIVSNLLFKLKLPAHSSEFYYFKSCIMKSIFRENKLPYSTSVLYLKVSQEFNVTPKQVERGIYKAVCHINKVNEKKTIINTILEYDIDFSNYELNAKELVALIADQLRIRYGIC